MNIFNTTEYSRLICQWFTQEFPGQVKPSDADLLDILTNLLVSTKENRYGPIPRPEILVNIRGVIKEAISKDLPIPLLVAWGGRKPIGTMMEYSEMGVNLDLAEVFAINQLRRLDKFIKEVYSPGLYINIRIEDLGADWLYRDRLDSERRVNNYSADLVDFINMVKGSTEIRPIRESTLMEKYPYFDISEHISGLINTVITFQMAYPDADITKLPEYHVLESIGWRGKIPKEQRDHYLESYAVLYPTSTPEQRVMMLSDYLAGAKARYDLNGRAEPTILDNNNYIGLSLIPPIPGAPESLFSKNLYWRTIPCSQGRTHIAPWRAKGYLRISNEETLGKITSFRDPLIQGIESSITKISDGNRTIQIATDYMIE